MTTLENLARRYDHIFVDTSAAKLIYNKRIALGRGIEPIVVIQATKSAEEQKSSIQYLLEAAKQIPLYITP